MGYAKQSLIFFATRKNKVAKIVYIGGVFKEKLQTILEKEFAQEDEETQIEIGQLITNIGICQQFPGWTIEYVEGLLPEVKAAILGMLEGQAKVEEDRIQKMKMQAGRR